MDSSIWVATITRLFLARAASTSWRCATHEGKAEVIRAQLEQEARVVLVLVRKTGSRYVDPRQIDPLAILEHPTLGNHAPDFGTFDAFDLELHDAIGEQYAIAGIQIVGEGPVL